jgi:hypothetical protein
VQTTKINMRTFLLLIIIAGSSFQGFGQQLSAEKKPLYNYLMAKSKQQRKTGKYLLIGGGIAYSVGALFSLNDGPSSGVYKAAPVILSLGSCSLVACIPFFLSAGSNRNKAQDMLVSFQLEKYYTPSPERMSASSYPALSIKIPVH